jgi:hypothetical protein
MTHLRWKIRAKRLLVRVRRRVPPGLRLVLGLLTVFGGILGFLPILGFWMIPLGVAIAALDLKPVGRLLSGGRRTGTRGATERDAGSDPDNET